MSHLRRPKRHPQSHCSSTQESGICWVEQGWATSNKKAPVARRWCSSRPWWCEWNRGRQLISLSPPRLKLDCLLRSVKRILIASQVSISLKSWSRRSTRKMSRSKRKHCPPIAHWTVSASNKNPSQKLWLKCRALRSKSRTSRSRFKSSRPCH